MIRHISAGWRKHQCGGFIYYINRSDHDRIYRIDTSKGKDDERITEDSVVQFVVSDRIYYINKSDGGSIYSVGRDGKGNKKLGGGPASCLFQNDGKLIYINSGDNHLYEMTAGGGDVKKLTGDRAGQAFIYSNRIYYIAPDDGNIVCSVMPDGTGRRLESNYRPPVSIMTGATFSSPTGKMKTAFTQ